MCRARAGNRYYRWGQIWKALKASGLTTRKGVGPCPDPNPKPGRVLSIPTKRGIIATRRFPMLPNVERTGVSSGDSVARQRALVGDPLNNEQ